MTDIETQVVVRVVVTLIVDSIRWAIGNLVFKPLSWIYSKWISKKENRNLPNANSSLVSNGMEDDDHMWDICETQEDLLRNIERYRNR